MVTRKRRRKEERILKSIINILQNRGKIRKRQNAHVDVLIFTQVNIFLYGIQIINKLLDHQEGWLNFL